MVSEIPYLFDFNGIDQYDNSGITTIPEGYIPDFISGTKVVKETAKEYVRQHIARALVHEYFISVADMESDFPVSLNSHKKKIDIAIFNPGTGHSIDNLTKAVICRPQPKVGRSTLRIRDYNQAEKDLEELKSIVKNVDPCRFGLWTNNFDFFYLEKRKSSSGIIFEPIGGWPPSEESEGSNAILSPNQARIADPNMLRITFRRCHNFIHGNEGMPKDAAFRQFLYLIFCKMHDEQAASDKHRFWAGLKEQFTEEGRRAIRERVLPLFEEVKDSYKGIFRKNEEITLSDRALAFIVSELAKYDFRRIEVDVKGAAYQEIVGANLRGDRGQYFTPRGVIKLAVNIISPKATDRILDPACGTGGFLVEVLDYFLNMLRDKSDVIPGLETKEEFEHINSQLRKFAESQVFGADFDPFLIKASQMNMVMAGDGRGHLYHINSLEFPSGYLADLERANIDIPLGSMDIILTNPPFGSDIPINDPNILRQYELAQVWDRLDNGSFHKTGKLQSSVAPEILFIERCLDWLRPGGRMGIVLPNGILGNPAAEYIRWWILKNTWVLASVDLPVEVFIVEADVNILTSLLFLKKKTEAEIKEEDSGGVNEYPVFMAVAEHVGFDRRGNPLYIRTPDGADIVVKKPEIEFIRVGGRTEKRVLLRQHKIPNNDLPIIARNYHEFRKEHPEPGK